MLELLYANSFVGKREKNEDAYLVKSFENGDILLIVADGMGGGEIGDILSKKAVEILEKSFTKAESYPLEKLYNALFIVNRDLEDILNGKKGATTLSATYYMAEKRRLFFVNIGDSRVWLCRDDKFLPITIDQNRYEERRFNNLITQKEDKRFLIASLGGSSDIRLKSILSSKKWQAVGYRDLQKDDLLILSTDGFHDYFNNNCKSLKNSIEDTIEHIKEISNDNITLIVAKEIG